MCVFMHACMAPPCACVRGCADSNPTYLPTNNSADAMPVEVDQAIDWDSVGGLREHITALKEMVMFPLLYPEYFQRFSVTPPRCVRVLSRLTFCFGVFGPCRGAAARPYIVGSQM